LIRRRSRPRRGCIEGIWGVTSLLDISEACEDFFQYSTDKKFMKSYRVDQVGEKAGILPALKWFLAARFKVVKPEGAANNSSKERIDFIVDNVAVEVAVRRNGKSKSALKKRVNASEIKKLIRWKGLAVLVLFDFDSNPLNEDDLEDFRDYPSLSKKNDTETPFNILYYCVEDGSVKVTRKNVRLIV
jgi:hypothetical protein